MVLYMQGPALANKLLPTLLMAQVNTLPSQCRRIEQNHDGVKFIFNIVGSPYF